MSPLRLALFTVVVTLVVGWPALARAWIELSTVADNVTIDVEADGAAVVAHEMMIRIRGGPLKKWIVEGIDADAVPMADATITRARSGRMAGMPIPLTLEADSGRLEATVQLKKGLRGGSYLIRFRYRSNFAAGDRITADGSWALLRWQSPRLESGIDSMRVLFRLPQSDEPPRLLGGEPGDTTVVEEGQGVFLSTVRRGDARDEIEIVRPHVAKEEIVTWKALVDKKAFELDLGSSEPPTFAAPAPPPRRVLVDRDRRTPAIAALVAGLLYALVIALKFRAIESVCRQRGAQPRPLVRLVTALRAPLTGILIAFSVWVAWVWSQPAAGGVAMAVAMLLAASLSPQLRAPLRGPGAWERIEVSAAFAVRPRNAPLIGRLFDAGDVVGFVVFAMLLSGFIAGAVATFPSSGYHAVMLALSSSALFPIFCTGRSGELPEDAVEAAAERLEPIYKALVKRKLAVSCAVRVPAAGGGVDELRLVVDITRARLGLAGIEVGFDMHRGAGGVLLLPFVIVRAYEATDAMQAMPAGLLWTRGRTADERVAVLRPRLPTRRLTVGLVQDVVHALRIPRAARGNQGPSSSKSARSPGRGASTRKPATASSPVHAT